MACQGNSGQEICNVIPITPSTGTTTPAICQQNGGSCSGYQGFKCTYLTNGQCLENPSQIFTGTNARSQADSYAGSSCGQVDQVCVGGSDNGKLCGNFTIIANSCGNPPASNPPTNPPSVPPSNPPGPMCLSITMSNTTRPNQSPIKGDAVRFTCGTVAGASSYVFRVIEPGSLDRTMVTLQATGNTSSTYTVTNSGKHYAQCQFCTGSGNNLNCRPFETVPGVPSNGGTP
jgi:hypothetical protein